MKIIVCIKQVPEDNSGSLDMESGLMLRPEAGGVINPEDRNALEAALLLGEEYGAESLVVSMGPESSKEALKEALTMGIDRGILVSDERLRGADSLITARVLARTLEKIQDYCLILTGSQSSDGNTGQLGPKLAELLDLPHISQARELDLAGGKVRVRSYSDHGDYLIESRLPALLTVTKDLNSPRYPLMENILRVYSQEEELIKLWDLDDLGLSPEEFGGQASAVSLRRTFIPEGQKTAQLMEGRTVREKTDALVDRLSRLNIV